MNREEAANVIALMQANYPDEFRTMSDSLVKARVNLWAAMFADEPFEQVKMAVAAHMATDTNRFMPPVGVIKNMVVKMSLPEEMTEQEAWGCVVNALRNSAYNSAAEFAKLPPVVQRLVGSASQLREWAMMDADTVSSVVASNFQRSYKVRAKNERETLALPSSVRGYIAQLTAAMPMDAPKLESHEAKALPEPEPEDPKARETMLVINRYRAELNDAQYELLRKQVEAGDRAAALSGLQSVLDRRAAASGRTRATPRAISDLIQRMEDETG